MVGAARLVCKACTAHHDCRVAGVCGVGGQLQAGQGGSSSRHTGAQRGRQVVVLYEGRSPRCTHATSRRSPDPIPARRLYLRRSPCPLLLALTASNRRSPNRPVASWRRTTPDQPHRTRWRQLRAGGLARGSGHSVARWHMMRTCTRAAVSGRSRFAADGIATQLARGEGQRGEASLCGGSDACVGRCSE